MDWDADGDSIYTSPEPQPQPAASASNTTNRRPVARMHASFVSRARKSLNVRHRKTVSRPHVPVPRPRCPITTNTNSQVRVNVPDWTVRDMGGKCPPFNDKAGWVDDPRNHRIYVYGGLAPGDRSEIPTSDFYVCDTTTMEWRNITNSIKFRNPYNPFSPEERHRKATPLPQLTEPGCTLLTIDNSSFIFIFGGYDISTDLASSKTIVVDLDHLEWWYLRIEGEENLQPRLEPAVVGVEGKLFAFGGCRQLGDVDPKPLFSYSVAEFVPQDGRWCWTVRDEPYSNVVPQGHLFGKAIPVYNGAKILLTPGRVGSDHVQFNEDNLFYYHIAKKKFQLADITGDFPTDVLWYSIHEHRARLPQPAPVAAATVYVSAPAKRGRPRKTPLNPPNGISNSTNTTLPVPQPTPSTSSSSPSLIICAWIPMHDPDAPENDTAAPELWQLFLTPDERIDRLNVARKVFELNLDFQGFMCVEGRMRLMGYDDDRAGAEEEGEEDEDVEMDPDAKWNIYLDVPVPNVR